MRTSHDRYILCMCIIIYLFYSPDHCMQLREFAGGDKDLFSAERKMRKQQRKLDQQRERQYQRDKQKEDSNVFNFINKTLGDKRKSEKAQMY